MARLTPFRPRVSIILTAIFAAGMGLTGCSGDSTDTTPTTSRTTQPATSAPTILNPTGQVLGGANAAPNALNGGVIPDDSSLADVMTLATDTSGVAGTLFGFWQQAFPQAFGKQLAPIPFKIYQRDAVVTTACEPNSSAGKWNYNAFYCGRDDTIQYEAQWMQELYTKYGDFAPVVILFHEYGHRIGTLSGTQGKNGDYAIQGEQQADCYAGLATAYLGASGKLNPDDINEAVNAIYDIGSNGGEWWGVDNHGTPQQRKVAFMSGYSGNVATCVAVGKQPPGSAVTTGNFQINVVNGTTGQDFANGAKRVTPPQGKVQADIKSYGVQNCTTAIQCLDVVDDDWFKGSTVTYTGGRTSLTLTDKAGKTVMASLDDIQPKGTNIATNAYTQRMADGTTVTGLFTVLRSSTGEVLVMDVFETGTPSGSPIPVDSYYFSLLRGVNQG